MSLMHGVCKTFYDEEEIHRCPEPCECCGLLIAVSWRGGFCQWVERFVADGEFCFMSDVVHTSDRCRCWRTGAELSQGLGEGTM